MAGIQRTAILTGAPANSLQLALQDGFGAGICERTPTARQ
jgi:hypothetical protein